MRTKIMKSNLKTRIDTYCKLSTHFAYLDDEQLNSLFDNPSQISKCKMGSVVHQPGRT